MEKPFKTIEEQIDILKDRKLNFKNEDKAKDSLLRNNYYNLINNYGKFISENDIYFEDVYFEDLLSIKFFDDAIKATIFEYIIEIEKIVKSIISYEYSKNFKDKDFPYLSILNYDKTKFIKSSTFIGVISNIISKYKNKDDGNPIRHYINKYNNVPIWVLSHI